MKTGTIDLLNSERGTLCVVLVIAATILVAIGKISGEAWLTYTQVICGILVASKTISNAVDSRRPADPPIPEATNVSPGAKP